MAIWHADNFSFYGTDVSTSVARMLDGVYAQVDRGPGNNYLYLPTDPDGLSPGNVLGHYSQTGNNPSTVRCVNPQGITTKLGVAFRIWMNKLPSDNLYNVHPVMLLNNAAGTLLDLSIGSTGTLRLWNGTTQVGVSGVPVISANGWYHVEILADQTNVEVRVEGSPVIGPIAHGLTTPQYAQYKSYMDINSSNPNNFNMVMYIKDVVAYDNLGSFNNTFLGSVICGSKVVTSDNSLNWTPSSGTTGYQILDNVPPIDTTYISAGIGPIPAAYVGSMSPLPATTTSVKALVSYVRAGKSDGGDGSLQVGLISSPLSSPATVLGQNRSITTSQTYWRDVFEVDPKTSAAWLPVAADAARIQINRTT